MTPVVLGFTGTQAGMTPAQSAFVASLIECASELHHGDCVGADAQAHALARVSGCRVVGHPPVIDSKRAFCDFDLELPPRPYLVRNHDIVDACGLLVAAPRTQGEQLRSGTWATVRYARSRGVRAVVVGPGGEVDTGQPME